MPHLKGSLTGILQIGLHVSKVALCSSTYSFPVDPTPVQYSAYN